MSLMAGLGMMGAVFGAVNNANQSGASAAQMQEEIKKALKNTKLITTNGSMTKLLSDMIIEPIAIVSNSLKHEEVLQKVLELNTDIFASFYLQVVEILKNMYGLNATEILTLTGSDNEILSGYVAGNVMSLAREERDFISELFKGNILSINMSKEDIQEDRLDLDKEKFDYQKDRDNEKAKADDLKFRYQKGQDRARDRQIKTEAQRKAQEQADKNNRDDLIRNHKDTLGDAQKIGSLRETELDEVLKSALIRNVELKMIINKEVDGIKFQHAVVMPITIKTHVVFTDVQNILRVLAPNSQTKTFGYRLDEYRAGAISFTDLIFAGDLIKEYKDNKFKDKEGLLSMINSRVLSANSKLLSEKTAIGFEKYYNMYFINQSDKVIIEKHLNGKLVDEKYKQKFLEQGHGMLLSVLDTDYERCQIFTKDIRGISDIPFRALAKRNSKTNDFEEIMKAMLSSRPPVF